jgi:hypothetical protein
MANIIKIITTGLQNAIDAVSNALTSHENNNLNPHSVTKAQVGLSEVPNLSFSGNNTGDETTVSIQTKRPLKTINNESLEGAGNIAIQTGVNIGTTPITNGANGRILFQGGNTVQQSSNLFWDDANSRLGVGTSTPTAKMHLISSGIITEVLRLENIFNLAANRGVKVSFYVPSGVNSSRLGSEILVANNQTANGSYMSFFTENLNVVSERLRIDSTGKVGIGTTSPTATLEVKAQDALSTTKVFAVAASGAGGADMFRVMGNGVVAFSQAQIGGSTGYVFNSNTITAMQNAFLGVDIAGGRSFNITNTAFNITYFRINAFTGNAGFGLTSPTAVIHVKAGTATAGTAPIKLTAGTNLTTPENGAFEFDGTNLYFTVGGVRRIVNLV